MAWTIEVDGTDITSICQQITWHPKLSRPASCVARFPANLFSATTGVSQLRLYNGGLLFSGPVWYQQGDGAEDAAYTELTAYDHLIYLSKRMCKTPESWPAYNWPPIFPPDPTFEPGPCNLADPTKVILDYLTAPEILKVFLEATADCDGSFPISVNSFATGGPDLSGFPCDWPMDIATFAELLLQTGVLDIIVNPGFGSSSVDLYNGDAGSDLSGSVVFQYGTGAYNSRGAGRTSDMEEVINALWYLLGPKAPQYTGDISHWRGSLTPDGAHDIDKWDHPTHPWHPWPGALVSRWSSSRGTYGYMQQIDIHDSKEDENSIRFLFEKMYQNESYLRAIPRTFSSIQADRSDDPPGFAVGDLITLQAGSMLGGGFSGVQRVYGFEISIDPDGVGEITDITASADQE